MGRHMGESHQTAGSLLMEPEAPVSSHLSDYCQLHVLHASCVCLLLGPRHLSLLLPVLAGRDKNCPLQGSMVQGDSRFGSNDRLSSEQEAVMQHDIGVAEGHIALAAAVASNDCSARCHYKGLHCWIGKEGGAQANALSSLIH